MRFSPEVHPCQRIFVSLIATSKRARNMPGKSCIRLQQTRYPKANKSTTAWDISGLCVRAMLQRRIVERKLLVVHGNIVCMSCRKWSIDTSCSALLLVVLGTSTTRNVKIRLENYRCVVYNRALDGAQLRKQADDRYTLIRFVWYHWGDRIPVVFLLEGVQFYCVL